MALMRTRRDGGSLGDGKGGVGVFVGDKGGVGGFGGRQGRWVVALKGVGE